MLFSWLLLLLFHDIISLVGRSSFLQLTIIDELPPGDGPEGPAVNRCRLCPQEGDSLVVDGCINQWLQHCEINAAKVVTVGEIREHTWGTITNLKKGRQERGDQKEVTAWIIQRGKVMSAPAVRGIWAEAKTPSPRTTGRNSKLNQWFLKCPHSDWC